MQLLIVIVFEVILQCVWLCLPTVLQIPNAEGLFGSGKNITRARLASLVASPLVILDGTRDVFSTTERLRRSVFIYYRKFR